VTSWFSLHTLAWTSYYAPGSVPGAPKDRVQGADSRFIKLDDGILYAKVRDLKIHGQQVFIVDIKLSSALITVLWVRIAHRFHNLRALRAFRAQYSSGAVRDREILLTHVTLRLCAPFVLLKIQLALPSAGIRGLQAMVEVDH
jgi:hypothetical protein